MAQEIIKAYESGPEVRKRIEELQADRALLLVGDKSSRGASVSRIVDDIQSCCDAEIIRSTSGLLTLSEVLSQLPRVERFAPDVIVAIGGGRVLDLAKILNALVDADQDEALSYVTGKRQISRVRCPLLAIPTTAGSGSESTHFAVVYVDSEKYSLASPLLLPEYAVLDGSVLESLPDLQRALSAFDALSQAIESYWSNCASDESRHLASSAIVRLMRLLPDKVGSHAPDDMQAMIEASNWSGRAINLTKTTAPHAYSYVFSYYDHISHGQAVAYTLPRIFDIHASAKDERVIHPDGPDGLRKIMDELKSALGVTGERPSDWFFELLEGMGLEPDFSSLNFDKERAIGSVNQERLANNPVILSSEDVEYVFQKKSDRRTGIDHDSRSLLKFVSRLLDESGVVSFADSGTLLGIIRTGDLLAHDSDIDIGILDLDEGVLASLRRRCLENGITLTEKKYIGKVYALTFKSALTLKSVLVNRTLAVHAHVYFEHGDYYCSPQIVKFRKPAFWPTGKKQIFAARRKIAGRSGDRSFRLQDYAARNLMEAPRPGMFRSAFRAIGRFSYRPLFKIFYKRRPRRLPGYSSSGRDIIVKKKRVQRDWSSFTWVVPSFLLRTIAQVDFLGTAINVPSRYKEYLALRYGEDWQTPNTDWIYFIQDGSIYAAPYEFMLSQLEAGSRRAG